MPNERLSALEDAFEANVTPVLIAEEMRWSEPAEIASVRMDVERVVAHWAATLQEGDMCAWLGLYDDSFTHWGMNRDEWVAFSLQTVGERSIVRVTVGNLLVLGDPVEQDLYLSRFRLEVEEAEGRRVVSMRRLYWRRSESGALKIVTEDSG